MEKKLFTETVIMQHDDCLKDLFVIYASECTTTKEYAIKNRVYQVLRESIGNKKHISDLMKKNIPGYYREISLLEGLTSMSLTELRYDKVILAKVTGTYHYFHKPYAPNSLEVLQSVVYEFNSCTTFARFDVVDISHLNKQYTVSFSMELCPYQRAFLLTKTL